MHMGRAVAMPSTATHTSLHLLLMPKGPSELTDIQVGFRLQVSITKKAVSNGRSILLTKQALKAGH